MFYKPPYASKCVSEYHQEMKNKFSFTGQSMSVKFNNGSGHLYRKAWEDVTGEMNI